MVFVGVELSIQKFLDVAKQLECCFLQKRLLLSIHKPEQIIKEVSVAFWEGLIKEVSVAFWEGKLWPTYRLSPYFCFNFSTTQNHLLFMKMTIHLFSNFSVVASVAFIIQDSKLLKRSE